MKRKQLMIRMIRQRKINSIIIRYVLPPNMQDDPLPDSQPNVDHYDCYGQRYVSMIHWVDLITDCKSYQYVLYLDIQTYASF